MKQANLISSASKVGVKLVCWQRSVDVLYIQMARRYVLGEALQEGNIT